MLSWVSPRKVTLFSSVHPNGRMMLKTRVGPGVTVLMQGEGWNLLTENCDEGRGNKSSLPCHRRRGLDGIWWRAVQNLPGDEILCEGSWAKRAKCCCWTSCLLLNFQPLESFVDFGQGIPRQADTAVANFPKIRFLLEVQLAVDAGLIADAFGDHIPDFSPWPDDDG